jgi:hypothetical protein
MLCGRRIDADEAVHLSVFDHDLAANAADVEPAAFYGPVKVLRPMRATRQASSRVRMTSSFEGSGTSLGRVLVMAALPRPFSSK